MNTCTHQNFEWSSVRLRERDRNREIEGEREGGGGGRANESEQTKSTAQYKAHRAKVCNLQNIRSRMKQRQLRQQQHE